MQKNTQLIIACTTALTIKESPEYDTAFSAKAMVRTKVNKIQSEEKPIHWMRKHTVCKRCTFQFMPTLNCEFLSHRVAYSKEVGVFS